MKKITVVLGTARKNNFSKKVADIVFNFIKDQEIETEFVEVADHLFGKTVSYEDDLGGEWKEIIEKTDGVIFVVPEYNHSYPGELKILIDLLYDEYKGKFAGVVSVSAGQFGGVRVTEKMNDLLHTVNFDILHNSINVSGVQKEIDEERIKKHLKTLLDEVKG
jgi:NAD(P)H-dependent FMN reductase